jgi:drug/metabolite transporter (DMT)-like permease
MWPTLALVYALVISKIKVAKPILFAIGIGLTVVAIIIEFAWPVITVALSSGSLLAILIAFVGANSWGLYSAVTRRFGDVSGGSAVTPLYPLSCGAIAALMIVIGGGDRVDSSLADLKISVPALFAALFNFIAYLCWDIGLRKGNIFSLTLLADFIPWMSLAAVSLLLGVELNWRTLMSALLLVAGAVIARLSAMRREIA